MSQRNIFIAGAAKSGTTALYYLLNQHPEICLPLVKEPNYFSNLDKKNDIVEPGEGPGDESTTWTHSIDDYCALYECDTTHRFRIDASVSYLYSTKAACYIAEHNDDAKIIIVLRNPADRAWSHYKHLVRDGRETLSFEEALRREEERIEKGWEFSWHLKRMGLYSQQLQRYYDYFDRRQIRIFLFDDIKNDLRKVLAETSEFLGLTEFDFEFDNNQHNVSGVSRSRKLSELVNWIVGYKRTINKMLSPLITHRVMQMFRQLNTRQEELTLNKHTRRELISYFESDIRKTSRLIGRDLSMWLN